VQEPDKLLPPRHFPVVLAGYRLDLSVDRIQNTDMKRLCVLLVAALLEAAASKAGKNPFLGRWDVTGVTPTGTFPSWMEVVDRDGVPEIRVQPRAGSVRLVSDVKVEGSRLTVVLSPATESRPANAWELTIKGNQLKGIEKRGHDTQAQLTAVRAPELKSKTPKVWSDPEPLFNGKDLTGWELGDPSSGHWVAQNRELVNLERGSNLRTMGTFDDFKLHIEYNCPDGGNTGVFLRGRYQLQIDYASEAADGRLHGMGSIYGYIAPTPNLPRKPGEWETFDVTLLGRYVTVVRDGVPIIANQEIPGITGGALDSNEGAPGPFNLQGSHTGGIKFRNITISLPKR
jgi:Domain of Unknown Function (DUF1080)